MRMRQTGLPLEMASLMARERLWAREEEQGWLCYLLWAPGPSDCCRGLDRHVLQPSRPDLSPHSALSAFTGLLGAMRQMASAYGVIHESAARMKMGLERVRESTREGWGGALGGGM
ncbi:hypothetical protein MHYP_G00277550 [Metynnis hypsauchen]